MFISGRSVVGLDIGSSAVKAVELTRSGQGVQITGFGQIDLASDDPAERIQAVVQLMKEGGFRSKRVVTSISGKAVIVRYLNMVPMSDDELHNAIRFEAEKFIPVSLDDCVVDCQRLDVPGSDSKGESTVVLVAAEKRVLDEHVGIVQKAGVTPEIVDVDAFALGNAFETFKRQGGVAAEDTAEVIATVDVGASKTTVNVLIGGVAVFSREIQLGGRDFTAAVGRRLGVDDAQAEAVKRCPGEDFEAVKEAVFPTLDDLGNELQLSFDYFEGQQNASIEKIWLSGGGSRMSFFRESLEKICEKPVEVFNPFDAIPHADDVDQEVLAANGPQLAIAVGLAARTRQG